MYRTFLSLFGIITLLRWSFAEPCVYPLGIEDGTIQLTASTQFDNNHGPDRGRLNTVQEGASGGAWVAGLQDQNQWIQADLGSLMKVTRVITQGRDDADQWVTSYEVLHSLGGNFEEIRDANGQVAVFNGNSDRNTAVTNMFHDPVYAKFIRIHPTNWYSYISLRFEVLGCSAEAILYNHHCYKFVSDPTTWNDAKAMCESFSSQLITINTEEELAYFTAVASTVDPFPSPWTGMNDIAMEGHPVWLTQAQPLYNEFTDNDDPENSDCFHIDTDGDMRYKSCDDEFGYVCETSSIIYESYSISERQKSPAAAHVVRSFLAVSSGACSLECGRLESCVSFSFSSSNECILSTSTGQSSELDDAEDADFYVLTSSKEICRSFT